MKYLKFVVACALGLALQNAAYAHTDGPAAYGDIHFGMRVDDVKKVYPSLEMTVAAPQQKGDEIVVPLSVYRLKDQKLDKLTCNIDFKFLSGILSYLDFYCADKENVPAYLEATYGPPAKLDSGWTWAGRGTYISYAPNVGTFTITNKKSNDALQGAMYLQYLMQQKQQEPQQPAEKPQQN